MTNQNLYKEMDMAKGNFAALVKKPRGKPYVTQLGLSPEPLMGRAVGFASGLIVTEAGEL